MAIIQVPVDFPTIQLGVNNAQEGDVVLVSNGTYSEAVIVMTANIRIVSKNKHEAVLDGGRALLNGFFLDNISGVEISGFKIQNYSSSGITVDNDESSGFHRLIDNKIKDIGLDGIRIEESDSNLVFGNTLMNNDRNGIQILGNSNWVVENEIIENRNEGVIIVLGASNLNNAIINNRISHNGTQGIRTAGQNTLIYKNHIERNNNEGVSIFSGSVSVVANNEIKGNFSGIFTDQDRNIAIYNQVTHNREEGIFVGLSGNRNIVQSNNVKSNRDDEIIIRGSENTIINNKTDQVVDTGTDNNIINNDD